MLKKLGHCFLKIKNRNFNFLLKRIMFSVCTSLIFGCLSPQALAQQEDPNLLAILDLMETDIATGTTLEQRYAPALISIVTGDEILRSGARTLYEALEQVPGLHVYPSDNFVMKPGVSIRGIQTSFNSQVLILVDGVRQNTGLNGSPALHFMVPTSAIQRIEIIRGPGSALYGADAFGGVINIITKKYSHIEDEIGVRYGSFNTWESWLNTRGEKGELKSGLTLSISKSDGDESRVVEADRQTFFDQIFSTIAPSPASLAPGSLNTEYQTLYISADAGYREYELNFSMQNSQKIGTQDGAGRALDPLGDIDRLNLSVELKHSNKDLIENTQIKSSLVYSYYDALGSYFTFPANTTLPFGNEGTFFTFPSGAIINAGAKEDSYLGKTNFIYTGTANHTINIGIGFRYEALKTTDERNFGEGVNVGELTDVTGTSFTFLPNVSRRNYYIMIQDEYSISPSLSLTSGIRYDYYNDFGSTFNPRLALVWKKTKQLTIKTLYGRAFRAPSFGELYFRNNPVNLGNKDLQPETIDTFEIALDYRAPITTKINFFYYQAKNLIDSIANSDGTVSARNNRDQNGYGMELEMEYSFNSHWMINGNYAYQHSEDPTTKARSANAPVQQLFTQLQYFVNSNWSANLQYHYIGKRYRRVNDFRDTLTADSLLNFTIEGRNIFNQLDLLLSVRNLMDSDNREPSISVIPNDYPMPSRNIFVELRSSF